ncbi:hypothetical protein [Candidatus Accumulibacter aalborgensis]|nr:hypothetical protein [Candidatus Accumulibacter aalborgensis]
MAITGKRRQVEDEAAHRQPIVLAVAWSSVWLLAGSGCRHPRR